jgi:uncharacterized Zn-binding protein involved in type VI secretion
MPPAARLGDMHTCPLVTPPPHVGGPILPPCATTVLVGNKPAARVTDKAQCNGPPDAIAKGSPTVLIANLMAARLGDPTVHGGVIVQGEPTVLIGEAGSTHQAIEIIKNSKFGQTEEGKKVIKKIEELDKDGKIKFKDLPDSTRGNWENGEIGVNNKYASDPEATASELVHEATHALNEDEFPASKTKLTIDEEIRTNTNQLDLYDEQKARGYNDPELDRRAQARKDGKLRDDVRSRYPGTPESL